MEQEFNPFELDTALSNAPITSIVIGSNLNWFDVPATLVGTTAVLNINSLTNLKPLLVFATDVNGGQANMIPLVADHIPNIEINQVNGLQSAINSIVKTFIGDSSGIMNVATDGVGDYTIGVNTGTTSSTVAVGNDTRFPASVTGIRKSTGAASTDTAAVAKTDYWDTTVFGRSGGPHSIGLVPDPGSSTGTTRYLREDATWVTPSGAGTVTSVAMTVPGIMNLSGSPITSSGTLALSLGNQAANKFWLGPTSGGSNPPTFRTVVYADVSPIVGQVTSTLAAGDDNRFPASVTGIRKSTGAGSTDVFAVARTDYWDTTVFGGIGPSSSIGLVPSPGNPGGSPQRYLREDGTWQVFTPAPAVITSSMLATMSAGTIKANATGSTASPTDVTAKTARSSSLLNLESTTTFGNADYNAVSTDKYIKTSATFTASHTVTLPLANTFNPGQTITIMDDFGAIVPASGYNLLIAKQGSDTIQGSSASLVMDVKFGGYDLASDGTSKWSVISRRPALRHVIIVSNTTYTTPTGCKAIYVEALGDGGGGGGAIGASSQCSLGSGGGGGGYGNILIVNPSATYAVTIGAGGAGGVGASAGSNGTGTSFGSALVCSGGNGGATLATGTAAAFVDGGDGQYISAGDWGSTGSAGGAGMRLSGTVGKSGDGGSASLYSGFTKGLSAQGDGSGGGGTRHFGGGGAGAASFNTSSQTGGAGCQGVVIITEYY